MDKEGSSPEISSETTAIGFIVDEVGFNGNADYDKDAETIAKRLIDGRPYRCDANESFVVAIEGSWGSGKTHFVNKVVKCIERNAELRNKSEGPTVQVKVMRFNPWVFSDERQLAKQFFAQLGECVQDAVEEGDWEEGSSDGVKRCEALQIVGLLISLFGVMYACTQDLAENAEVLGRSINAIATSSKGLIENRKKRKEIAVLKAREKSLAIERDRIYERMEEFQKGGHVVVVIDDIDRLRGPFVSLIFQLVAAVANFPGVSYLLAYDRDAVCDALGTVQLPLGASVEKAERRDIGSRYIQKVITVSHKLPSLDLAELTMSVISLYKNGLSGQGFPDKCFYGLENCEKEILTTLLSSPRNALRAFDAFDHHVALGHKPLVATQCGLDSLLAECVVENVLPEIVYAARFGTTSQKSAIRCIGKSTFLSDTLDDKEENVKQDSSAFHNIVDIRSDDDRMRGSGTERHDARAAKEEEPLLSKDESYAILSEIIDPENLASEEFKLGVRDELMQQSTNIVLRSTLGKQSKARAAGLSEDAADKLFKRYRNAILACRLLWSCRPLDNQSMELGEDAFLLVKLDGKRDVSLPPSASLRAS